VLGGFPGRQFEVNGLSGDASIFHHYLQPLAAYTTEPILLNESLRFSLVGRGHNVFDIENPALGKKVERSATGRIQATGEHNNLLGREDFVSSK
jgi:hypothetical protein